MTYPTGYPSHREGRYRLSDGTEIHVRPILPSDANLIRDKLSTADADTLYKRFFTPNPRLSDRTIRHLAEIDYHHRMALVAFVDSDPIAIARYEGTPGRREAEIAFVVDPQWRSRGAASLLGELLVHHAAAAGIDLLEAFHLSDNPAAAATLTRLGFERSGEEGGVVTSTRRIA